MIYLERRKEINLNEYKEIFLRFTKILNEQFEKNLDYLLVNVLNKDRSLYDQAMLNHHKDITDKDLLIGIFDVYAVPEWLTMR